MSKNVILIVDELPINEVVVSIDKETGKEEVDKQKIEFVSQGNFSVDLEVGEIEVESEVFADYLVRTYGFEKVSDEDEKHREELEAEYPKDFPMRKVFIDKLIALKDAKKMSRDELIDLPKIGEKWADNILEYIGGEE